MSTEQTFDVVSSREFDRPVDEVWQAWVRPDLVQQWWGPKGFTCPTADMDVRVGGRSLVCMRAPAEFGGQDMYNTWTYEVVERGQRLAYTLNFTDSTGNVLDPTDLGLPPGIPRDVPHVVTLEPLDGGRTRLTVSEYGYATPEVAEVSRSGLEECLDKMVAVLS
jgi:uncharacterized protein YndB with AHSA1/START domain